MSKLPVFQPVDMLDGARVFNFERGTIDENMAGATWGIGRYGENRPDVYSGLPSHDGRTVHVGIDFFAPEGTPVYAVTDGTILRMGINAAPGDYGPTIVAEHFLDSEQSLFVLYGHLGSVSLRGKRKGQPISGGDQIGVVGSRQENGGWAPHLHFQLSTIHPCGHDMPGVVKPADFAIASRDIFPDPRTLLGSIY